MRQRIIVVHGQTIVIDLPSRHSHLYLIQAGPFVKVGIANDPRRRIRTMQPGCPFKMRLILSCKRDYAASDESELKKRYRAFQVQSEWFKIPADELKSILTFYKSDPPDQARLPLFDINWPGLQPVQRNVAA